MSNTKYDDGSQEFFDEIVRKRIRRQYDQQRIDHEAIARARSMQIQTEEAKKAIEFYKKVPFYAAKNPNEVIVKVDGDGLARKIDHSLMEGRRQTGEVLFAEEMVANIPMHQRQGAAMIYENLRNGRDPYPHKSLLQETLGQQGGYGQPQRGYAPPQQQQQQGGGEAVSLLQGSAVFKSIESQGFGSTVTLARSIGQADARTSSYQFIYKGTVDAYIVPPNQTVINLQLIESNPNLKSKLAILQAPPMAMANATNQLGTIMVPLDAIVRIGEQRGYGGGQYGVGNRQVITDSRYGGQNPMRQGSPNHAQQMMGPQRPGNKTILRG